MQPRRPSTKLADTPHFTLLKPSSQPAKIFGESKAQPKGFPGKKEEKAFKALTISRFFFVVENIIKL